MLKKEWAVVFLTLLKDLVKKIINTWSHIIIIYAYNLCGKAMSQHLTFNEFKWLNQNGIDKSDVNLIGKNSSDGCILEVNLEYPNELQ